MRAHVEQFASAGIPFVFDPGQGLPLFSTDRPTRRERAIYPSLARAYEGGICLLMAAPLKVAVGSSGLLISVINGRFDLAKYLLDKGANPKAASDNGVTPLYAALNCQWAPKALYPQPRAYEQQTITYLDLMKAFLDKGADPNVQLKTELWFSNYNFELTTVDATRDASVASAARATVKPGERPSTTMA